MSPKARALRAAKTRYEHAMQAEDRDWRCSGVRRSINHSIARIASDASIRWFMLYERLLRRESQGARLRDANLQTGLTMKEASSTIGAGRRGSSCRMGHAKARMVSVVSWLINRGSCHG